MATVSKKRLSKIARQKLRMRDSLWSDLDPMDLWFYRERDGWLTIPRAMPLLMRIMDDMSIGKPISSVYLDLWCRTYDDSFVITNKPREMAFSAGFTGQRAERTWADRIGILAHLGFIDVKPGPNGRISYVLIWNPYYVIKYHHDQGSQGLRADAYNALMLRAIEIKADDLDEPEEPVKSVPGASRKRSVLKKTKKKRG